MFIRKGETSAPAAWSCKLQSLGAAEQQRSGDGPERVPFAEDHQRDGNEAAPRRHSFRPSERECDRQVRPRNAAEEAAQSEGLVLQLFRPAAGRISNRWALADRA